MAIGAVPEAPFIALRDPETLLAALPAERPARIVFSMVAPSNFAAANRWLRISGTSVSVGAEHLSVRVAPFNNQGAAPGMAGRLRGDAGRLRATPV